MSAAPSVTLEAASRRNVSRRPLFVPLDVIALRSGIPENLPGRCTDLSEGGVGAIVAGELIPGQQVALELRLPNVGVPVRARALVRYQQRLRCGLQFVGLTAQQREMIRYWANRVPAKASAVQTAVEKKEESPAADAAVQLAPVERVERKVRKIRLRLRRFYTLLALTVALTGLGWWQWERSWNELEAKAATAPEAGTPLKVSPEIMEHRITYRPNPEYPEAARRAGKQGMVVLDAVIGADGRVKRLAPISGADALAQAATVAVQSWTFDPYLYDGKPIEVETTISVEFRLR